ncbi:MAG: hypothetical protein ACR2P1_20285 [Pseudomonadales bacterium]
MRRALAVILVAAYPLLIYFGLQVTAPRMLVLLLLLMAGLRWLAWNDEEKGFLLYWLAAILIVVVATLITGSTLGLLFYPLLMNLVFLTFFAISLYKPPTVVETIARKQHGELPVEAVSYTRKVTMMWCLFFILNGSVSLWTAFLSREVWVLYNGLIAYLLMALVMGAEYLVRHRVMNRIDA